MLTMAGIEGSIWASSRRDIPPNPRQTDALTLQGFLVSSELHQGGLPSETGFTPRSYRPPLGQVPAEGTIPRAPGYTTGPKGTKPFSRQIEHTKVTMSGPTKPMGPRQPAPGQVRHEKPDSFTPSPEPQPQPGDRATSAADITVPPSASPTTIQIAKQPPLLTSSKPFAAAHSRSCPIQRPVINIGENSTLARKSQQNILVPWKKRPLKSSSTNFHCIADLVKPCSKRENIPACVTSRLLPMAPDNRPALPGSMTSSQPLVDSRPPNLSGDHNRSRSKTNAKMPDSPLRAEGSLLEEDIDVGAPDRTAVPDASLLRGTPSNSSSDLIHSTNESHPSCQPPRSSSSPLSSTLSPRASSQESSSVSNSPPAPGATEAEASDPNRLRKGRTIYKAQQVYVLEQVFSRTHYPDPEVIETLSRELDISENKIKVWFQNKRARWRRRAAETGLPPQPIGFTLSGTPGLPTSWPHPTSLPSGVIMPQPVYSSPYGGPQLAPRPGFPHVGHLAGLSTSPLYLGFDTSLVHPAAKGLSGPALLPYGSYPMSVLPAPTHIWGESPKLPGT